MVIDARDRFMDRFAETVLQVTKKDGPVKAALRTAHLPTTIRLEIKKKTLALKKSS